MIQIKKFNEVHNRVDNWNIQESDLKNPPDKYIHKTPSSSVKSKNKFVFITDIQKSSRQNYYDVTLYKWSVIDRLSGKAKKYGYEKFTSLLTAEEIKSFYDFDVRSYFKESINKITTSNKQKNYLLSLGIIEDDLRYLTNKNYQVYQSLILLLRILLHITVQIL